MRNLARGVAICVAIVLSGPAYASAVVDDPVPTPGSTQQMIETRSRFFGAENVDQRTGAVQRNRLVFSWFGVTSYAAAIRGHVVLLDAYFPRGPYSDYVPTSTAELANLRPETIFIGHAHFDHAADATPLALATGATLVGTEEQCEELRARTSTTPPECVAVVPAGAALGRTGEFGRLEGISVLAMKHPHSARTEPTGSDEPFIPPPTDTIARYPPTPEDALFTLSHQSDQEGGSLLYRFAFGRYAFVWNDTNGPLVDQHPEILPLLRRLGPVDLQLGSIAGFNLPANGFRDARTYVEAIRPKIFVPGHHDDWLFAPLSSTAANFEVPFVRSFERIPARRRPRLIYPKDPADYINPRLLTFRPKVPLPRLRASCRRGSIDARITGDTSDLNRVTFRLRAQSRADRRAPYRATLRAAHGGRLRAKLLFFNEETRGLKRPAPRC